MAVFSKQSLLKEMDDESEMKIQIKELEELYLEKYYSGKDRINSATSNIAEQGEKKLKQIEIQSKKELGRKIKDLELNHKLTGIRKKGEETIIYNEMYNICQEIINSIGRDDDYVEYTENKKQFKKLVDYKKQLKGSIKGYKDDLQKFIRPGETIESAKQRMQEQNRKLASLSHVQTHDFKSES